MHEVNRMVAKLVQSAWQHASLRRHSGLAKKSCAVVGMLGLFGLPFSVAAASDCESPLTVKSGDTLSEIAQRCRTTVSAILVNNPQIDESGAVRVGERIHLPAADALYSDAELEQLLGPIALHPDVLLAEILPASTYPLEIVQAARWLKKNPRATVGDEQDWDKSVKALTRYPDVLEQLNEDIGWTEQLGEAFLAQPDAVFDSIQRLRQRADANGYLKDNDVQDIVHETSSTNNTTIIRIVHADPYYVYVPSYDPYYVYSSHRHYDHGLHFGVGLLLGGWLHHTLDWHHRHLFYSPYHATSYQRFYRYRHYRPYYSYNRHINYYGRKPYPGLRWRHDYRRYDGHYRNAYRHRIDRYTSHRRTVDNTHYRRGGYNSYIRDSRTLYPVRDRDGNRVERRTQRPQTINTRAYKGTRSYRTERRDPRVIQAQNRLESRQPRRSEPSRIKRDSAINDRRASHSAQRGGSIERPRSVRSYGNRSVQRSNNTARTSSLGPQRSIRSAQRRSSPPRAASVAPRRSSPARVSHSNNRGQVRLR